MIEAQNLTMEYKIARRDPGLTGAIKSLFVRRYETKQAVKGINLKIERGEMVGYIGANGAGKSTTIKMLTGIMTPTAGTVKVNGIVPYENREANAKQIGAVFGQRTQLFWDIPVRESFNLLQHIYEVPTADFQQRLAYFTEVLDLAPLVGVPVRQLSLGQKMRCELAAAFLHILPSSTWTSRRSAWTPPSRRRSGPDPLRRLPRGDQDPLWPQARHPL
jgi:ABC-2 type transport system ATP-binding protein